jgi:hypothetical protein
LRNRYTTKDAATAAILATTTSSTPAATTTTQHVPNPARDNSTRANAN